MIFPRVTIYLLLVAFPAAFSQYDNGGGDDGGDGGGNGGGNGSNCECSDITLNDGNSGEIDCDEGGLHFEHFYFHRDEYWELSHIIQWKVLVLRVIN